MTTKTYTGRNLEVAVSKAAKAQGISPSDLKYDVLAGSGGGFALIRLKPGGGDAQSMPQERLTGSPSADRPEREERSDDDRRDGRRGGSRGGRGGRRDGGGRGRRDGGGRGGRGGRRDGGGRGRRDGGGRGRRGPRRDDLEEIFALVPDDGPSEVVMKVAEGVELSEIGEDAHEVFKDLVAGMGFGVTALVTESEDLVRFDIEGGSYGDALAAKDLHLVNAIQHLVDKTVNFDSDDRKKILVDVDGAKARADEDLGNSAREVAQRVLDEGQSIKMGPMDARSRRLVHIALRDVEGVVTRSEGEGAYRRVCVEAKA